MRRTKEEKAADRDRFRNMPFKKRLGHVWYYYKWRIIFGLIALILVGSTVYQFATQKDRILYLGLTNATLSADFEQTITTGFLEDAGRDPDEEEIYLYRELYLSKDAEGEAHKSAYATNIKLMASVERQVFDAVLMSRQAYDILSSQGYPMDLDDVAAKDPSLRETLAPILAENEVYLLDNDIEYQLGEAESHEVVSETAVNAVCLSAQPLFASAGFQEPVYFGIIANTPRLETCLDYLQYLIR